MSYTNPTVNDFKTKFARDFPYADDSQDLTKVINADIQSAMSDVSITINQGLFGSQDLYTLGFLLLSAHFLVTNLRNSSQGINGQFEWLASSKSVGSVSEGISIPERILANPEFAMLSKTTYGAKYLFLILPMLSGVVYTVCGATKP